MRALLLFGGMASLIAVPWIVITSLRGPIRPQVAVTRLAPGGFGTEKQTLGLRILGVFGGLVSDKRRRDLDSKLAKAGYPANWSVEKVVAMRWLLMIAFGGLGMMQMLAKPGALSLFVVVVGVGIGWVAPERLVAMRGEKRQEEVHQRLADVVDQLAVMVRAGMSLDSAMVHVANTIDGVMGDEVARVVQDIRMGIPRREALFAMAARVEVPDLDLFVRAIVQSDELGVPIADTLRTQSAEMRLRRRQHAEETAMKLPVKVLMPTMVCIVPALLIVVVGPAVISLIETLGS